MDLSNGGFLVHRSHYGAKMNKASGTSRFVIGACGLAVPALALNFVIKSSRVSRELD